MPGRRVTGCVVTLERRRLLAQAAAAAGVVAVGGLSLPSRARAGAPAPAPTAVWRSRFDGGATSFQDKHEALSTSGDSSDIYFLAYGIDGFTTMFGATGEKRYADVALGLVENTMATAQESGRLPGSPFEDDHLGWASQQEDTVGREVPLYESYGWRYAIRLLRVLRTSSLYDDSRYRARYDAVLAFGEDHIFDKWHGRGVEEHLYRSRTHMASHWAFIANDLALLTGDRQRRDRYEHVARTITEGGMPNRGGASLRSQFRRSGQAYVWSDRWGGTSVQDLSHGNNVISYVVEARDTGRTFSDEDIDLFVGTLNAILDVDDGRVANVDGSGTGAGWLSDGFVKLGRYDPAVQRRLEALEAGRDLQYVAALADNAAILDQAR